MSSETASETAIVDRSPAGYVAWRAPFGGAWHIVHRTTGGHLDDGALSGAARALCELEVPSPAVASAARPLARVSAAVVCRWCRYQLALEHRRAQAASAQSLSVGVAGLRRPLAVVAATWSPGKTQHSTSHSTGLAPDPPIVTRPVLRARAEHVACGDPCPAAPSAWAAGYREQGSEWSTGRRGSELTSTKTPTRN